MNRGLTFYSKVRKLMELSQHFCARLQPARYVGQGICYFVPSKYRKKTRVGWEQKYFQKQYPSVFLEELKTFPLDNTAKLKKSDIFPRTFLFRFHSLARLHKAGVWKDVVKKILKVVIVRVPKRPCLAQVHFPITPYRHPLVT